MKLLKNKKGLDLDLQMLIIIILGLLVFGILAGLILWYSGYSQELIPNLHNLFR